MQAVIISGEVETSVTPETSIVLNAVCCVYILAIAWNSTLPVLRSPAQQHIYNKFWTSRYFIKIKYI